MNQNPCPDCREERRKHGPAFMCAIHYAAVRFAAVDPLPTSHPIADVRRHVSQGAPHRGCYRCAESSDGICAFHANR